MCEIPSVTSIEVVHAARCLLLRRLKQHNCWISASRVVDARASRLERLVPCMCACMHGLRMVGRTDHRASGCLCRLAAAVILSAWPPTASGFERLLHGGCMHGRNLVLPAPYCCVQHLKHMLVATVHASTCHLLNLTLPKASVFISPAAFFLPTLEAWVSNDATYGCLPTMSPGHHGDL